MIINVKDIPELPQVPTKGTPKSAAYDVFAVSEPEIVGEELTKGVWKRIEYIQYRTALYAAPQKDAYGKDYHVLVHPRSSVSKYNLLLANGIGLCDSDYRGEYLVRFKYVFQPEDLEIVVNPNQEITGGDMIREKLAEELVTLKTIIVGRVNQERIYKKGDRVCQLVVEPTVEAEWVKVEDLDKTERAGGFGSTDNVKRIPVGQSNTITISSKEDTSEFVKRMKPLPGIKEKPAEHEKNYETKVDLIDQWRKAGGNQEHPSDSYEKLIKQREQQLGNPK